MTAWKIRLIVAAGVAVLAVIWILQNVGMVQTKLLFVTVSMPLSALLAITLLMGIAVGILLALIQSEKWNKKKRP